ncbi:MAG: hypothetical protein QX191_08975 [Methylococcaceae bacterium]
MGDKGRITGNGHYKKLYIYEYEMIRRKLFNPFLGFLIMQKPSKSNIFKDEDDNIFDEINLLTKYLHDLDDRGLVLSLSAFAEDALGSLLKGFMIPSKAASLLLEGFNAPLGTFSSRIKASYAFGLITEDQFHDLERLRKIRNEFAHTWQPTVLSQPKMAAQIKAMNHSRLNDHFPETLADKVRSSMSCLLVELRSATHQNTKRGTQALLIGNHLISGFVGKDFQAQFQNARKELLNIQQKLQNTEGEKREFYRCLLRRFLDRVSVLKRPKTSEEKQELLVFLVEVKHAILQSQTV